MTLTERLTRSRWAYGLLALFVLACAVPGVLSMPPLDRDESRFSQASAQMLETGDYVVIRYHDGLRNKKPAGIHWLQAASTAIASDASAREIWSYRLPSLAGAVIAAFAVLWGGSAIVGRPAALLAAIALSGSLLLSSEAHIAKTDAALCGVMALLLASLGRLRAGKPEGMAVLFWTMLAAGVLLKGVISPMIAALCLSALWLWERQIDWARPLLKWHGPALFLALALPWFVAVQILTDGAFLWEAAAVDLGQKIVSAAEGHEAPPGAHLASLPLLFWPAVLILLPGVFCAALSLLRDRAASASDPALSGLRLLVAYALPSWLVFELTPTKLVHYPLPLYPALALMGAAGFLSLYALVPGHRIKLASSVLFALLSALLAAATTPPVLELLRADPAATFGPELAATVTREWNAEAAGLGYGPAIAISVTSLAALLAFWRGSPGMLAAALMACSLAAGISLRQSVLPSQGWMLASKAALSALEEVCALPGETAVRERSGCGAGGPKSVSAIAYAEPSLVFELAGAIELPPESRSDIPDPALEPQPAWLLNTFEAAGRDALSAITAEAALQGRCMRTATRYAYNYSNGEPSILTAVIVDPGPCTAPASGEGR